MSAKIIALDSYRASVRLDGTTLCWLDRRHELSRERVADFCEALEHAIVVGLPKSGAGFRVVPGRRTITIIGHGMGPMVLGSRDEAAQFGIRLMTAALKLPMAEPLPAA